MKTMLQTISLVLVLLALDALNLPHSIALAQGSLTPPGAPAPTMKTLAQIEPRMPISSLPFTITQPGSYYAVSNLTLSGTTNGITVLVSDVTIDLGGFTLDGNGTGATGIAAPAAQTNLVVRNGIVKRWQGTAGIEAFNVLNVQVTQVQATDNAGHGIRAGAGSRVSDCTCSGNGSNGVVVWDNSLVAKTIARLNGSFGIVANNGSTVSDCASAGNRSSGISTGDGATIVNCSSQANGGTNNADGIWAASGSTVTACSATENTGNGIIAGFGCTLSGNTARANKLDGIRFNSSCGVTGNTCDFNGNGGDGAGLHALGQAARIEGNHCVANDRGIDVDGDRNVIIRNTCGFNTVDYDIVANNKVGVIVSAPNSAAISGSTGGTGLVTTDPWANFSF
jgi:hypothetical protein